jgi:hypothetical protein
MLKFMGKTRSCVDGMCMVSMVGVEAQLVCGEAIITRCNLPEIEVGDMVYTRHYAKAGVEVTSQMIVVQKADDFDGYRLCFTKNEFKNRTEAYTMCVEFLKNELGVSVDEITACMNFEDYEEHGLTFARSIDESLHSAILAPSNAKVAEYKFKGSKNLEKLMVEKLSTYFSISRASR